MRTNPSYAELNECIVSHPIKDNSIIIYDQECNNIKYRIERIYIQDDTFYILIDYVHSVVWYTYGLTDVGNFINMIDPNVYNDDSFDWRIPNSMTFTFYMDLYFHGILKMQEHISKLSLSVLYNLLWEDPDTINTIMNKNIFVQLFVKPIEKAYGMISYEEVFPNEKDNQYFVFTCKNSNQVIVIKYHPDCKNIIVKCNNLEEIKPELRMLDVYLHRYGNALTISKNSVSTCVDNTDTIENFYTVVSLMQKNFTKFRTNMSLEKFVNIFMTQLNHDYSNIHWHNPLDLMPHMDCVIFTGYIHNKNKLHDKCNVLKIYFYSDTNTIKFIYPHYLEFKPSFYYLIQYAKLSQSIIGPKEK